MDLLYYLLLAFLVGLCDITQTGLAANDEPPAPDAPDLTSGENAPSPVQASIQPHQNPPSQVGLEPQSEEYAGLFREEGAGAPPAGVPTEPSRPPTWRERARHYWRQVGRAVRSPFRGLGSTAQRARRWLSTQAGRLPQMFRRSPRRPSAAERPLFEGLEQVDDTGKFYLDAVFAAVAPLRKAHSALRQLLRAGTPETSEEVLGLRRELHHRREWLQLLLDERDEMMNRHPRWKNDIISMTTRAETALQETSDTAE